MWHDVASVSAGSAADGGRGHRMRASISPRFEQALQRVAPASAAARAAAVREADSSKPAANGAVSMHTLPADAVQPYGSFAAPAGSGATGSGEAAAGSGDVAAGSSGQPPPLPGTPLVWRDVAAHTSLQPKNSARKGAVGFRKKVNSLFSDGFPYRSAGAPCYRWPTLPIGTSSGLHRLELFCHMAASGGVSGSVRPPRCIALCAVCTCPSITSWRCTVPQMESLVSKARCGFAKG